MVSATRMETEGLLVLSKLLRAEQSGEENRAEVRAPVCATQARKPSCCAHPTQLFPGPAWSTETAGSAAEGLAANARCFARTAPCPQRLRSAPGSGPGLQLAAQGLFISLPHRSDPHAVLTHPRWCHSASPHANFSGAARRALGTHSPSQIPLASPPSQHSPPTIPSAPAMRPQHPGRLRGTQKGSHRHPLHRQGCRRAAGKPSSARPALGRHGSAVTWLSTEGSGSWLTNEPDGRLLQGLLGALQVGQALLQELVRSAAVAHQLEEGTHGWGWRRLFPSGRQAPCVARAPAAFTCRAAGPDSRPAEAGGASGRERRPEKRPEKSPSHRALEGRGA